MGIGEKLKRKIVQAKKKIGAMLEIETEKLFNIVSEKSNADGSGGLWAYDYINKNDNHSVTNWHYDVEPSFNTIKAITWNDTPPVPYSGGTFNYIHEIAKGDLSIQTKKEDYALEVKRYKDNVIKGIRKLNYKVGIK